jgi:small-conductance mechanosensitive channel
MSETVGLLLLLLIFLEVFEIFWQRGKSFKEYVENLFWFYKKGIIIFILLHPTLYFVMFAQILLQNWSFLASLLVLVKVFDVGFKISLMDKIYNNKDLGSFKSLMEVDFPISMSIKGIGLILYSLLFFFAFS